jgi:transcription elongation factor GreA
MAVQVYDQPAPSRQPSGAPRYDRGMAQTHQLSKQAHERLSAELEDLTTRGRVEIARAIETARELGDLSENGDYHAAKDQQGKMEARIRQLQGILEDAEIVEQTGDADEVTAGAVVTIRYEGDDDTEKCLIGSIEERVEADTTVVSPGSPLGRALIGAKPGSTVSYETPTGATLKVEVVSIGG